MFSSGWIYFLDGLNRTKLGLKLSDSFELIDQPNE